MSESGSQQVSWKARFVARLIVSYFWSSPVFNAVATAQHVKWDIKGFALCASVPVCPAPCSAGINIHLQETNNITSRTLVMPLIPKAPHWNSQEIFTRTWSCHHQLSCQIFSRKHGQNLKLLREVSAVFQLKCCQFVQSFTDKQSKFIKQFAESMKKTVQTR